MSDSGQEKIANSLANILSLMWEVIQNFFICNKELKMLEQKVWSAELLIESPVATIPIINGVKFNTDNNLKEINSVFFIVMAKDPMRVRERILNHIELEDAMRIIDIKVTKSVVKPLALAMGI